MAGLFSYKVIGVREYKEERQYEVECQTCSHGWKCVLLIAEDDDKKLRYIRMVDENEDHISSQKHFHTHCGEFHLNKSDALIWRYKETLKWYMTEIDKFKANAKSYEEKKNEIFNLIKIQEDIKNEAWTQSFGRGADFRNNSNGNLGIN